MIEKYLKPKKPEPKPETPLVLLVAKILTTKLDSLVKELNPRLSAQYQDDKILVFYSYEYSDRCESTSFMICTSPKNQWINSTHFEHKIAITKRKSVDENVEICLKGFVPLIAEWFKRRTKMIETYEQEYKIKHEQTLKNKKLIEDKIQAISHLLSDKWKILVEDSSYQKFQCCRGKDSIFFHVDNDDFEVEIRTKMSLDLLSHIISEMESGVK